ncbi:hypothetical protein T01_5749 [Trichinella spiralis]|uniref:Uncharacterized protein n=1 Tax=Trichinella spiralis TaxID=6334 RepID=A0A0V1ASU5_TRISP|nr:hypothetical protein T01_5749 [Trichinella spiralis]
MDRIGWSSPVPLVTYWSLAALFYWAGNGGQEHSYLLPCFFFCSISCFQSQLTDFPMYRLAEVEVAALYPRIRLTPRAATLFSKA